jgi:ABC-type transporter Mla MlaB component
MPTSGSHEVAFAIRGPIRRADLSGLCDRVCSVLAESTAVVVDCDVASVDADAVTVDALARLQLAALSRGCTVRLQNASEGLLELVELMGLTHVLSAQPRALLGKLEREPEAREERGGVEEEGQVDDASILDLEHL